MAREPLALEPGEEITATAHASFRGATATSAKAAFALGSARARHKAYDEWLSGAVAAGVGSPPADMVMVLTDRRLLLGRPRFWGGRPDQFESEVSFAQIADVIAVRHGLYWGAAFAMTNGRIFEVEALRGRSLRRLVAHLHSRLDSNAG